MHANIVGFATCHSDVLGEVEVVVVVEERMYLDWPFGLSMPGPIKNDQAHFHVGDV